MPSENLEPAVDNVSGFSMLQVQELLVSGGTLAELKAELGINAIEHPTLPLVVLNYNQIESPKLHPVVRECRGLILNSSDWSLVARSFPRFFNWGEVADEMGLFAFEEFVAHSKEDGSLCVLYYFDGVWHGNTRGSFGLDAMQRQKITWRAGFLQALGVDGWSELDGVLDRSLTYICEFVSPWNKIVRKYAEPRMYLLTAFRGEHELSWDEVDALTGPFLRPQRHAFHSIDEIQAFLLAQGEADPTFEGVVIRDRHGARWKVKSATYLGLHRMHDGQNLYLPKNLLPFVLAGETAELLTYFPEVEETFFQIQKQVDAAFAELLEVWTKTRDIELQKEFALSIVGQSPFTNLLFGVRKQFGREQTAAHLAQAWRESGELILKVLFR